MLTALGSDADKVFPRQAFDEEMRQWARFGVGMCMESLPFSVMDDADTVDLDEIEGDEALPLETVFVMRPIKTQFGRKRLADALGHGIDCGYLD